MGKDHKYSGCEVVSPLLAGCNPFERETLEVEPGDLWTRETWGVVTTYASRQCKGLGIHGIGPEHRIVYEVEPDLVAKATHNTILRIDGDEINPETGNETVVVWAYKDPWINQQVAKGIVDDEPFFLLHGRRIDSKPVRDVYETLVTYGERIRVSRYPIPPWVGEVYSQTPQSGTIKSATIQEIVVWDDALPGEYKAGIRRTLNNDTLGGQRCGA